MTSQSYKELEQTILFLEQELSDKDERLSLLKSDFDSNGKPLHALESVANSTDRMKIETELKDALEKVREKESDIQDIISNFEAFFNTIDDFLFVLDEMGNILHCNETVIKRLGYTLEELNGMPVLNVHPEERRNDALQIITEMLSGKSDFCPIPLITKQGKEIYVETRISHGVWNGKPALFGVSKDISKLKLSEEKFSTAFYLNPSACGLSEADSGRYVEVNEAFYRLFGFTKEETIGHTATELQLMPEKTRAAILSKADSLGRIFNEEAELRTKNGEIKRVLLSGQNIQIQDHDYRYTVVHDVTEIHKAKEKIEESEGKFRNLYESLSLAYLIIKDGVCIECNEAALEIYKADKKEEIIGKSPINYSPEFQTNNNKSSEEAKRHIKLAIEKGFHTFEWLGMRKNKEEFYAEVSLKKFYFKDQLYIQCLTSDITERKRVESELIAAKERAEESDRLKTAFLQNMSHEIRTPLNAICGFSAFLDDDDIDADRRKSYVQIIQNNSNQLLSIVSDVLTISALETKQAQINISKVCINDVIVELLAVFKQQASNQTVSLLAKRPLSDKQSTIYTDKTKITQILTNLLTNALKFTHDGFIEFGYLLINDEIEFYMKDSGIGVKPELHEKIFERFCQADKTIQINYGGTGLGLSICKGFVELLGGKIRVQSEFGKGSTFYFTLPYKPVSEMGKNTIKSDNPKG
ncbi:MAG: PAS domain S-box protein [Bacteroidales bacterium]|nr:PAS domain S-box protein [Bacteroidales bacterium]